MFSRNQRILGLDIGSSTVKGVELAKNGDRFTITGYAQAEIASAGTLKEAIATVIREGRFKSKQVVSSVSGRSVIVRYINTPTMKPEELRSSMRFEADKYIPFEMDEVILDCVPLEQKASDNENEMRVVLVAVKREVVDEHVRLLQELGLFPYIIDVDCFALGNAFENAATSNIPAADDQPQETALADEPSGEEPQAEATEDETADEYVSDAESMTDDEAFPETLAEEEAPSTVEEFIDAPTESYDPKLDTTLADTLVDTQGEADSEDAGPNFTSAIPDLDEGMPGADESTDTDPETSPAASTDAAETPALSDVYALIDIGAQKTNINIMQKDTSCFTREVYIGGEDMTEAVSKHLGLSPVEAETVKRDGEQEAAVLEAVGQTLDDLANEIFLSFDYFENQFESEIETVYLSGGGARLKGITDVLSQTLGRRVMTWNPVAGFEISLAEPQVAKLRESAPQLAVAMGLASRLRKV